MAGVNTFTFRSIVSPAGQYGSLKSGLNVLKYQYKSTTNSDELWFELGAITLFYEDNNYNKILIIKCKSWFILDV